MVTMNTHNAPQANIFADSSPRSFFNRNMGLIVTVSLLVAVWMLIYTFTMFHPKYGAKATVIIKDSAITNRYVEPEQYYAMQTTTSTSSNPVLNTMGILKSEAISEALWAYFTEKHPEELKKLKIKTKKEWDSYYQDGSAFIKAKNQPGTDLITIQFSWSEPAIAQESLTVVVKAFQEASRDLNKEEQISRTKFLSRQMGDIEGKLQAIRAKKSEYQSLNGTVSIKRESDDLAGSRTEISNKLAQLQAQAQGKENLVRRYQQMLGMTPEAALRGAALGQNSTMVKLQDELYRLQQLHSLMSSSLTDNNPKVREVQAQIDQVTANISQEKGRVMGPFGGAEKDVDGDVIADSTRNTLIGDMLKAQGEAQDLRAQASVIQKRLGQINSDIRLFPTTEEGLADLDQQEATLSVALDHLRQKVMEGKIKEAQTLSNVFIVDAPRLPDHPSFPNRVHLIVISLVMAVASGVSVAFIKEQVFSNPTSNTGYAAFPGRIYQDEPTENAEDLHTAQFANTDDANADDEEPEQPEWQRVAATNFSLPPIAPEPVPVVRNVSYADDMLGTQLPVEKVNVPTTGSLFDSLLPIAGPMARSIQATPRAALRRDLTQALPPVATPAGRNTLQSISDEDLLPPASVTQSGPQVHVQNAVEDVPVLHAAPTATPRYQQDPLSVITPAAAAFEAVDEFPSLAIDDEPAVMTQTQYAPPETAPIEHPATALYESQAKAMPLPRRRVRSVPAFLLDPNTVDVEAEDADFSPRQAPYELIPKKQRSQAPVKQAPVPAPIQSSNYQSNEAMFQDLTPIPASTHVATLDSEFPPMPTSIPPEFLNRRRGSLFGGLFTSKKYRQPELVLGGGIAPKRR